MADFLLQGNVSLCEEDILGWSVRVCVCGGGGGMCVCVRGVCVCVCEGGERILRGGSVLSTFLGHSTSILSWCGSFITQQHIPY